MMKIILSRSVVAPVIATLILFAVWELSVRLFGIAEFILPSPTATFVALNEYWSAIWLNAFQTLFTTVAGFLIAIVFGFVLGVAVGASAL
ncbi:MAG: ABC transporter permease, partial [Alphaproteobacteria bacterium]